MIKIWQNIDNDLILLLNGARQVGKTTLMKMVKEKLRIEKNIQANQFLWFDLEQSDDLDIWSSQTIALSRLPKQIGQKKYFLFIDEFQRSKTIGSILKVIHDHYPHIKTIITGSASWYLDLDESMAGRKQVIDIWPLDFLESIQWSEDDKFQLTYQSVLNNILDAPPGIIELINNKFWLFANTGGYPDTVLSQNNEDKAKILREMISSYLLRDIKIWNYAVNSLEVKKLLTILASLSGKTLSVDSLSINTKIGRTALVNRVELLQNTFVIHLIHPYFTNKIKEITKSPKIYFTDNGIRNSLLYNFSVPAQTTEFGPLAENAAAMELLKNMTFLENIYFWRTVNKQEVDLVKKHENVLTPIEIKSGNEENIPEGLKSFIRQYKPKDAYVLNWSIIKDVSFQDCPVYFRPIWFAANIKRK